MRLFTPLLALLSLASSAMAAPYQSKAPYALLVDISDGRSLYEKRADAAMAPASTTKILTAEVVFNRLVAGQLKLDDTFAISGRAATEGDAESGGSSMFLASGSKVRVRTCCKVCWWNPATTRLSRWLKGSRGARRRSPA